MVAKYIGLEQEIQDIPNLVSRVADGKERILLTAHGEPKAALVSMSDYQRLVNQERVSTFSWEEWLAEADEISDLILNRRGGEQIDVNELMHSVRADLEAR